LSQSDFGWNLNRERCFACGGHLNVTAVTAKRNDYRNEALIGGRVLTAEARGDCRIMSLALRALLFVGLSAVSTAVLALPYLFIH
jgi:hypothetical protein